MAKQKTSKESLVIKKDNGKEDIVLDYGKLKKAVLTLRALNNPLRRNILGMLVDKREKIVTEIYTILKLEQSVASQHLKILRDAEIVTAMRKGKFIYYSLNKKRIAQVASLIEDLAQKE